MDQKLFLDAACKYKDTVFRIAINYLGNKFDAEDTVQEVMLKLFIHSKPFDSEDYLKNWLIRVTINACKNNLRMPWRRKNVALDELRGAVEFTGEEDSGLFQTVMSMPEKYRTVLYLFYYEELSVKEISTVLKVSITNVTTRLERARKQLKCLLTEVYPG